MNFYFDGICREKLEDKTIFKAVFEGKKVKTQIYKISKFSKNNIFITIYYYTINYDICKIQILIYPIIIARIVTICPKNKRKKGD